MNPLQDDSQRFRAIFDAHLDPLRRFVYSYVESWETAEEIVHDAFLRLWRRQREGTGTIREVKTYLYTTARNLAVSYLRHQNVAARYRSELVAQELAADRAAVDPEAEARVFRRDLMAHMQRAIDALPPRQREVILLKWERHLTHEKIAQILGVAEKTVDAHFKAALERLRGLLPRSLND